ncbi:MAG: hypothetical protein QF357_11815, partial [Dehalococcoidia bacterium]|nr:hypothetical protein [Dehalococcoidia bacterium]
MRKLIPLLMIAIALSAFVLVKGPTVGATGGASKVLLAASEGPSIGAFLKAKLEAEGIPTVDVLMSSHAPAPPLATLLEYDTVIAWSDSPFDTGTAWGDVLADYVDAGGGLIINTFAFYTTPPYQLEGRIMTPGYSPLTPIQSVFGTSSLGAHDSSHPIMAGVTTVTSWYRDHTALDVGATLVASWADGRHMVAHNADCNIVGITLWPGREITPTSPYGWGGDVPRLFANAANFVA